MNTERPAGGTQQTTPGNPKSPLLQPILFGKTNLSTSIQYAEITPSKTKTIDNANSSLKVKGIGAAFNQILLNVENGNSVKKQINSELVKKGFSPSENIAQNTAKLTSLFTSPPQEMTPAENMKNLNDLSKELDTLKSSMNKLREGTNKSKSHKEIIETREYKEETAKLFTSQLQEKLAANAEYLQKVKEKDHETRINPIDRFSRLSNLLPDPDTPLKLSEQEGIAHQALVKKQQETEKKLAEVIEQLEATQKRLLEEAEGKNQVIKDLEEKNNWIESLKGKYESQIVDLSKNVQDLNSQMKERDDSKNKHHHTISAYADEVKLKNNMIEVIKAELNKCDAQRMMNLAQLQELRGNLRIYCRLKPLSTQEERAVILKDKVAKEVMFCTDPSKKSKPVPFVFDHVFGEPSSQSDVFREIEPFVQSTLDGKQISIFAYGPTGSGKTHTLEGQNDYHLDTVCNSSGIMPRSLNLIIEQVNHRNLVVNEEQQLDVYLSCLEIYNERLGDLLGPRDRDDEVQIQINKGKVALPDVVKRRITTMREALDAIRLSSDRRQTEATAYNSRSSRSHSIYRISICKRASGEQLGLLNIIDMAGSEKNSLDTTDTDSKKALANINNDKLRKIQKEANFINKSLTTLGRIIRLIKQQRSMGIKDLCIPYRESKLTRMLQDCIGGEAQTLMIVNINPSSKCVGQTKETLNFSSVACV